MAAAAAMKNHTTNAEPSVIPGTMTANSLTQAMEALKRVASSLPVNIPICSNCNEPDHFGPCYCSVCSQLQKDCTCSSLYPPSQTVAQSSLKPWEVRQANMEKIQKQIKEKRLTLGMTQKELAKKSGFSQGTITRAENNGWISIGCLLAIANGLGEEIALVSK